MEALRVIGAPLAAVGLALWAALCGLAGEAPSGIPRVFAGSHGPAEGELPPGRRLFVAHLALLCLAGAAASTAVAWWVRPPAAGLGRVAVAALLVWVVADGLPRLLGAIAPDLVATIAPLAHRTLGPFRPLFALVAWADRRLPQPRGGRVPALAGESREMLVGLFALSRTTVAEVMTPRIDMVAVDAGSDGEEVVATLRRAEHARLPVFDGHPDNIVGVLYAKDVLARLASGGGVGDWAELVRPVPFVPEGKTLDRQLRDFQRGPSHIAVVVDEFGGTAGLVTLEDILEEIVGEIRDEHDVDEAVPIAAQAGGEWQVQGGIPLAELEEALGWSFGREDVSTVGGLVLAELGHVPRPGEVVRLGPWELVAEVVARRRVRRVRVRRAAALTPDPGGRRVTVLVLLLGLLLALVGASAGVALVAVGQGEAARAASRELRGGSTDHRWFHEAERNLAAASALAALGAVLAGAGVAGIAARLTWLGALGVTAVVGVPAALAAAHLLPRRLGAARPQRAADLLLPVLRPLAGVLRLLLPSPGPDAAGALEEVWREGLTTGVGSRDQLAIAGGVLAFRERTVRDVMTPRTDIVAVAEESSLGEITEVFAQSGYSRLPVYRGTLDEIVGMLHAFDLFRLRPGDPLPVRPVAVTPASRSAAALLVDMQRERRHLAVVLDEFGGTLGIVSLEDLLEELVGEIFDEHDLAVRPAEEGGAVLLEADGSTPVEAVEARFGVTLGPARATTVAGLLAEAAGRIPRTGDRFLLGGLEFDVLQASPARAERVVIRPGPVAPVSLPRRVP